MRSVRKLFSKTKKPTSLNVEEKKELSRDDIPDKLVNTTRKNCHVSFGGYWDIHTYEKPDGELYNVPNINCIKCNVVRTNLYSQNHTSPMKKIPSEDKMGLSSAFHDSDENSQNSRKSTRKIVKRRVRKTSISSPANATVMKLTQYGYNISPTSSEPSPTSGEEDKYHSELAGGQMSFKTGSQRKSKTSFYKSAAVF